LRSAVIATAGLSEALACQLRQAAARMGLDGDAQVPAPEPPPPTRAARYPWAMLLARIYEVLPLVFPRCSGAMRILAFVTEVATVRRVLEHVGEAATPSPPSPLRAPPGVNCASRPARSLTGARATRILKANRGIGKRPARAAGSHGRGFEVPIRSFTALPFIAGLRIPDIAVLGWLLVGLASPALGGQSLAAEPTSDERLPARDGSHAPSAPT
jgi:hypothetical protein